MWCFVWFCDRHFVRLSSQYSNGMIWSEFNSTSQLFHVPGRFHFGFPFLFRIQGVKDRPFYQRVHPLGGEPQQSKPRSGAWPQPKQGDQEPQHHLDSAVRLIGSRFVRGGFVVWPLPGNCHFGMICREIFRLVIKWDPFLGGSNNILQMYGNCEWFFSFNRKQSFCKMELKQNKMNTVNMVDKKLGSFYHRALGPGWCFFSWVPRVSIVFFQKRPSDSRSFWLPSRELTHPPKMAFWRWFSFSQGGIC